MTPREKALEAAVAVAASLAAALSVLDRTPQSKKAFGSDKMFAIARVDYQRALDKFRDAYRAALATPSEPEWLPTPLADPPGDAVIEGGDWVRTRSGCVLGPIHIYAGDVWWSELGWLHTGQYAQEGFSDLDITHVRKAVK